MDPQIPTPQANISVTPPTQPVQSPPLMPKKKSKKMIWIIGGIIVLLIGIGIGVLLRH